MKRWLLIGGIGVVAIIGVAVFVFSSLDSLVKAAVEKFGSQATGAKVTLNAVKILPTDGKGTISGLTLGNPKGFATGYAIKVGRADIVIDMKTLTESTVVIKEIRIASPDVIFEQGTDGSNFDAIRKNVEDYIGEVGGGTGGKSGEKSGGKSGGKKLIIENFIITNGTVNVSAAILGGRKVTAPLPDIHLRDIGRQENGASPGAVAEKIIAAIGGGAGNAVAALGLGIGKGIRQGIGEAAKAVTGVAGQGAGGAAGIVGEGLKGAVGIVEGGAKGAVGIVEGGASAIGGVLKGVFGGGGGGEKKINRRSGGPRH